MIGIIDSGVGGLSILQEVRTLRPYEQYIYCADTQYNPYGDKSYSVLCNRLRELLDYLSSRGVSIVIIACNTISGAILETVAPEYPSIQFFPMLPYGLQGIQQYNARHIGIWATKSTVEEGLYTRYLHEYFPLASIESLVASQLVLWAEEGIIEGQDVENYILNLYSQFSYDIDMLVLGCTHFPLFTHTMQSILSSQIVLYNPASSIAHYINNVLGEPLKNEAQASLEWYITGKDAIVYSFARKLSIID